MGDVTGHWIGPQHHGASNGHDDGAKSEACSGMGLELEWGLGWNGAVMALGLGCDLGWDEAWAGMGLRLEWGWDGAWAEIGLVLIWSLCITYVNMISIYTIWK